MKNAVILLSGGIDSTTALAIAREEGYTPHALTILYGQRHARELESAQRVAAAFGVTDHAIISFDLRRFGGSALTADLEVPKDRPQEELRTGIPVTYVPARNTIFLSFALAFAETLSSTEIFIGANVLDASGYPDCRPAFLASFEATANLATRLGTSGQPIHIRAPLIAMTKAQIIERGLALGVDYSLTWSCYDPQGALACGRCDTCQLRLQGFEAAGMADPLPYAAR